jgi:hypothetical protein
MLLGLVLLGAPGSSSAQESAPSPSPKELWNAYPLDPGGTSPTVEPQSPVETTNAAPSPSAGDGGFPTVIVIVLAAGAFAAGLALGRGRRRPTQTDPASSVRAGDPSPERRFTARDYPPPARPAPPPPPVPGATATAVAVDHRPERGGRQ